MPNKVKGYQNQKSFKEFASSSVCMREYFLEIQKDAHYFGCCLEDYQKALEAHSFYSINFYERQVYQLMRERFFEKLFNFKGSDKLKDEDLKSLCSKFFEELKPFCEKILKMNGAIFLFPMNFKKLDNIKEKYDPEFYNQLKSRYKQVCKKWEDVFKEWNTNYVKKLSEISEVKASDNQETKKVKRALIDIILLQIKFQQAVGGIILQTLKWLDDINNEQKLEENAPKKPTEKPSFLKKIFSRKKKARNFNELNVFNDGKISPDDVRQAGIGDCYLMAVLITLSRNNPETIRRCFLQSDEEIEKARILKIRLHTVVLYAVAKKDNRLEAYFRSSRPYVVNVPRENLKVKGLSKTKALWPLIIQEAYAEFRKKYFEDLIVSDSEAQIISAKSRVESNDVRKILRAGQPMLAYVAITGRLSKVKHFDNSINSSSKSEDLLKEFKEKQKSTSATCCFKKTVSIKDAETGERVLIYNRHAYAVESIDEHKKIIKLNEPNRVEGARGKEGSFSISFKDFDKYSNRIDFSQFISGT